MQNALFTQRMQDSYTMDITLPIRPAAIAAILHAENESGSREEDEAICKMLAEGATVLLISSIVEASTPQPGALCSIEEDGIVYSFMPARRMVQTKTLATNLAPYTIITVPGLYLTSPYILLPDGFARSVKDGREVLIPEDMLVYTNGPQ